MSPIKAILSTIACLIVGCGCVWLFILIIISDAFWTGVGWVFLLACWVGLAYLVGSWVWKLYKHFRTFDPEAASAREAYIRREQQLFDELKDQEDKNVPAEQLIGYFDDFESMYPNDKRSREYEIRKLDMEMSVEALRMAGAASRSSVDIRIDTAQTTAALATAAAAMTNFGKVITMLNIPPLIKRERRVSIVQSEKAEALEKLLGTIFDEVQNNLHDDTDTKNIVLSLVNEAIEKTWEIYE
jgi:hypothetical protein